MSVHPQVRVFVRPYGSVVPLGFLVFGLGMFLFAALDAGWVKPTETHTIGYMLLAFVAPIELLATVFAFLSRDTVAGVALGLFSGSWVLTGVLTVQAKPGVLSPAQGYFLFGFVVAVLLLASVAWLGQPLIATVLTISSGRAVAFAIYEVGGGKGWETVSGWIAFAIFCIAMYVGLAFLLEDVRGRAVLPLGRRGSSREAIEGDMAAQLAGLADEPGVRKHL
jgi:succinate-acetate transporter protein